MSTGSVLCNVGKQIFFVRPEDVDEINRIREYCDEIALERISQFLELKYPNALEKDMDWD